MTYYACLKNESNVTMVDTTNFTNLYIIILRHLCIDREFEKTRQLMYSPSIYLCQ